MAQGVALPILTSEDDNYVLVHELSVVSHVTSLHSVIGQFAVSELEKCESQEPDGW